MISHLTLHHSGIITEHNQFLAINSYHKRKGFPKSELGFHVGYHYVLDRDRQIHQARNDWERGAHTVANGADWNAIAIGICIAGDFTHEEPQDWQIILLAKLVRRLQLLYNIPNENILLHRELKATSCPGADWRELANRVPVEEPTYLKINQKRLMERLFSRLANKPQRVYERALRRLNRVL